VARWEPCTATRTAPYRYAPQGEPSSPAAHRIAQTLLFYADAPKNVLIRIAESVSPPDNIGTARGPLVNPPPGVARPGETAENRPKRPVGPDWSTSLVF
jgi:hypothetical protein